MKHKNEYLVRLSETWYENDNINIESGKYEGAGLYRMIHAESFEEAVEKWNDTYCPDEFRREWGECGVNESLVMVIDRKGLAKFYMYLLWKKIYFSNRLLNGLVVKQN